MSRMRWCRVIMLLLWGIITIIPPTNSCSCLYSHPQQHFCTSDFAILAKVQRKSKPSSSAGTLDRVAYKIRLRKVFKTNDKVNVALEKSKIYTGPDGASCHFPFQEKTVYILTGHLYDGRLNVNLCNFAAPWRGLTSKMKKGFRLLYQSSCNCEIQSCHWWMNSCPDGDNLCKWETSGEKEDCQKNHAICSQLPDGNCGWVGGRKYKTCMKNLNNGNDTTTTRTQQTNRRVTIDNNVLNFAKSPSRRRKFKYPYERRPKHTGYRYNKIGYVSNYIKQHSSSNRPWPRRRI